jgi:putative transposase
MPSTHHGILLHFVFSTKNRVPLIDEHWQDELFANMGATAREHKATVLCSGGIEDHVHLLDNVHPSYAIADTVQLIKANASR